MTWKQKKEVEKQVYELVPVTKNEMNCNNEKRKREHQRAEFRKLIIQQMKEKQEY